MMVGHRILRRYVRVGWQMKRIQESVKNFTYINIPITHMYMQKVDAFFLDYLEIPELFVFAATTLYKFLKK
jgi:phenylalanyl-tRNA synthetase alpha subunit